MLDGRACISCCEAEQERDLEEERLERLAARLGSLWEAAAWANEELKSKIERSSLTLGGTDLLLVMSRGEGVRELLEVQMKSVLHWS